MQHWSSAAALRFESILHLLCDYSDKQDLESMTRLSAVIVPPISYTTQLHHRQPPLLPDLLPILLRRKSAPDPTSYEASMMCSSAFLTILRLTLRMASYST